MAVTNFRASDFKKNKQEIVPEPVLVPVETVPEAVEPKEVVKDEVVKDEDTSTVPAEKPAPKRASKKTEAPKK